MAFTHNTPPTVTQMIHGKVGPRSNKFTVSPRILKTKTNVIHSHLRTACCLHLRFRIKPRDWSLIKTDGKIVSLNESSVIQEIIASAFSKLVQFATVVAKAACDAKIRKLFSRFSWKTA
ncbi:hypothetical protein WA026_006904 [Henosepilachna vigintioctopunctata]|uniref:Uncharacterized protein n=1 Tax=Henosepilachna vigintioctopunctata TaxID=420089 RepID=A0AAW1VC12_9CUCU